MPPPGAARIDLAPLERLIGFTIHSLDLRLYQLFYAHFSERWLTPGAFATLLAIRQNPGIRHGALAQALLIRRPNLTKLVNHLERDGYLRRGRAGGDRRSLRLFLAPKGARALERMRPIMAAQDRQATAGLAPGERARLRQLLGKLSRSLEAPRS